MNKLFYPIICLFCFLNSASAENKDSLNTSKHFIRPTIYINAFGSGKQKIKKATNTEYRFSQSNIGGYFPLITKINYDKHLMQSTFQLIGFGNILTSRPRFSLFSEYHRLTRLNLGCNSIYTKGKNTFLLTLSPFKAQDKTSLKTSSWRMSWMFIYNRTVNENFSFRLGYVRSFVLDGNPNLPLVGFRIGRYDGVHLTAQFPRNVALNVPFGPKLFFSIYVKSIGSIYDMRDVEYAAVNYSRVVFRRNDFQRGFEFNYKGGSHFNFYFGMGVTQGNIKFSEKQNFNFASNSGSIASGNITRAVFTSFGLQYSFGSAKRVFNNQTMLDAMKLNQQAANSDLNTNPNMITPNNVGKEQQIKNVQLKDIEDMIDVDDLN
jgi:hypothetical protein